MLINLEKTGDNGEYNGQGNINTSRNRNLIPQKGYLEYNLNKLKRD